jgi:hypothetical protein
MRAAQRETFEGRGRPAPLVEVHGGDRSGCLRIVRDHAGDGDEPIGIIEGHLPEHDGVDDAVDGGIRGHGQSQRRDDDRREPALACDRPPGVADVAPCLVDGCPQGHEASGLQDGRSG